MQFDGMEKVGKTLPCKHDFVLNFKIEIEVMEIKLVQLRFLLRFYRLALGKCKLSEFYKREIYLVKKILFFKFSPFFIIFYLTITCFSITQFTGACVA